MRGKDGALRGFYNVCQHRAHELLKGNGRAARMESRAYRYSGAARARQFGSWWLWPELCIEVFPRAPDVNIFRHLPVRPEQTRHVFEFYM